MYLTVGIPQKFYIRIPNNNPVLFQTLKARSHGPIFLLVTAMQKMDCVDVNEGVHTVRFHVRVMHWCMQCHT